MISDQDRSGWFGASDTATVMGNWKTKTFSKWWMTKLGLNNEHFTTRAMNAGTYYEHEILRSIGAPRMDHQILIPDLKLRVNLDGDAPGEIFEVKTHSAEKEFKVSKAYRQQVNVEMFAKFHEEGTQSNAQIVAYGLLDEDYRSFFNEIDKSRIRFFPIEYDTSFIGDYLHRLRYLAMCLERGAFPDEKCV